MLALFALVRGVGWRRRFQGGLHEFLALLRHDGEIGFGGIFVMEKWPQSFGRKLTVGSLEVVLGNSDVAQQRLHLGVGWSSVSASHASFRRAVNVSARSAAAWGKVRWISPVTR